MIKLMIYNITLHDLSCSVFIEIEIIAVKNQIPIFLLRGLDRRSVM